MERMCCKEISSERDFFYTYEKFKNEKNLILCRKIQIFDNNETMFFYFQQNVICMKAEMKEER